MPLGRARHLAIQAAAGERVIQIAPLAIEHVRIRQRPQAALDQVYIARRQDRVDRVFLGVRVQVAADQHIAVARGRRVGRQPRHHLLRSRQTGLVAVALAIAQIGVARDRAHLVGAGATLRFEMIDDESEFATIRIRKRLRQRRPVALLLRAIGQQDRPKRAGPQRRRVANQRDNARLVDDADLDRVGAKRVGTVGRIGVDQRVRPGGRRGVQPRYQITDRAGRTVAVVLDLHQAKDIGTAVEHRRHGLGRLALKLGRVLGTAALGHRTTHAKRAAGRAKRVEVVQYVERRDLDRAADRVGAGRPRVGGRKHRQAGPQRVHRADTVGVAAGAAARPGVRQHADDVAGRIAAAQRVAGAQRVTATSVDDWVLILAVVRIIENDLVQVVGRLLRIGRRTRFDDVARLGQACAA